MTDLECVKAALIIPPPQMVHDHPIQTQIDKVVSLIEQEKVPEAAILIEKLLAKGILDIRLLAYYSYAHFFQEGVKSFSEIFPLLASIITEHWEGIKPLNRKDKQVQNSLNWLIQELITKLKYIEKLVKKGENHPIWTLSIDKSTSEELEAALQKLTEFKEFFLEKWPQSPTKERILHLLQIVNQVIEFKQQEREEEELSKSEQPDEASVVAQAETTNESALNQEPSPPAFESQNEEQTFPDAFQEFIQEEEHAFEPKDEELNGQHCSSTQMAEFPSPISEETIYPSERMQLLMDKLKVFEALIKDNDHLKAALVAKDIDENIATFDPLQYFPKLFSNYFSLVARHVAALSGEWEKKDSLQVKYLEKLYKTDLDRFMGW